MACLVKRRGRWVIDFYDQHGKRRWKTLKEGTKKKDAKEELRATEEMVSKGLYRPVNKMPTFSKVAEDWLEYKKPKVRITTWTVLKGHVYKHFKRFADYKIDRITTADIEKFITENQKEGMNINTLRKILVTFNQIFKYSVRHKYIGHNPLTDAERPRETGLEGKGRQDKIHILTTEQVSKLIEETKAQKYRILFMFAVFSGARQGEVLGLKWNDIDWENSQAHIQRTFTKGMFFGTKTESSNRKIDLGPMLIKELKKWKLACPKNKMDLVFPNEIGRPINYTKMMNRHFKPTLRKAELPQIRFHDLRHTYASLLIEQGENIKYIQSQLGHSNPMVTLNVYAHLMKPTNQQAACRLEKSIFG